MKTIGFLTIALTSFALALPGAPLKPGDVFPRMEGRTLDNKAERALPGAAEGRPFFALFVSSRGARDDLKNWATALLEREETREAAVFQVPVLARAPGFMRGMIRRDIRNDAPESVHHTFLLLTEDYQLWRDRLGIDDESQVYVVAVSADGRFMGSCSGPFSEQAFRDFVGGLNAD